MRWELSAECFACSRQSINISYNYWRPSGGRDLLRIAEHLRGRAGVRPRTSASQPRVLHCFTLLCIFLRKRRPQREAGSVRTREIEFAPRWHVYLTRKPEGSDPRPDLVVEPRLW